MKGSAQTTPVIAGAAKQSHFPFALSLSKGFIPM